ncbi:MAG: hypothetical protein OEW80_09895 [Gemmatimonadota bacterium]|nr:hypothetical protein [Gemmatimonadota bacterium]
MDPVRAAAGFEGLIVLAIIYFVLNALQKAGEKARRSRPAGPPPPEPEEPSPTQEEGFSLEGVLREIERLKAEQEEKRAPPVPRSERALPPQSKRPEAIHRRAPPPMRSGSPYAPRGPVGRPGTHPLPSAEEVEVRETWEEGRSLEVEESLEILDETRLRPPPVPVDRDDEAEGVVEARIRAAELRNRSHSEADHRSFHERMTQPAAPAQLVQAARKHTRLQQAIIWREILGPPRAFDE